MWQAIACLTCTVVPWIYLDDFGASEFSGHFIGIWSAVGVLSLLFVAVLSVRSYSKVRADI